MKKHLIHGLAILVLIVMLMNVFPIAAFALEKSAGAGSVPTMQAQATSVSGVPGKTVSVKILISDNPGIASLQLFAHYDEALLTLTDVEFDSRWIAASGHLATAPTPYTNPQPITCINPEENMSLNGTFATLTFRIAENAPNDITTAVLLSYNQDNVYAIDDTLVAVQTIAGSVRVYDKPAGDVNQDGAVNVKDAVMLFQHVAGWSNLKNMDSAALDVDGNNKVTTKDAITLFRYCSDIANKENIVLYRGEICAHNLAAVSAKAATCETNGNIAYWTCGLCNRTYGNQEGTQLIALENTVIIASGHTEVKLPAVAPTYTSTGLTEGVKCSVCHKVIIAQQEVPKLEAINQYAVVYENTKGAVITEGLAYYSELGLAELPTPEVLGYDFVGWFDSKNAEVKSIPTGTTGTVVLTAKWTPTPYKITYDVGNGTNHPNNVTGTYTIESPTFTLADASLDGRIFLRWEDQHGNAVEKIEKGTTGDIHLTAIWTTMRYNMVPVDQILAPKYQDSINYNAENNLYTFVYYLGYVTNIPLTADSAVLPYNGITELETSYTVTTATQESIHMGTTTSVSETISSEISSSLTSKLGVEEFGVSAEIEATIATSLGMSTTTFQQNSYEKAVEKSEEVSEQITITIPANSPQGYYRYVYMGTADVFKALVYDPETDTLAIEDYFIVREGSNYALDYSTSFEFDDHVIDKTTFTVPTEVEDFILSLNHQTEGVIISSATGLVERYVGTETEVFIPAFYNGKPVTGIVAGTDATNGVFAGKNITSVTFGGKTFPPTTDKDGNLVERKYAQFITEIPAYTFAGCTSLETVNGIDNLTTIGNSAFRDCTSLDLQLPDTVTSIGNEAFAGCSSLSDMVISNTVTTLGTNVFSGCTGLNLVVYPADYAVAGNVAPSEVENLTIDLGKTADSPSAQWNLSVADKVSTFRLCNVKDEHHTIFRVTSFAYRTVIEDANAITDMVLHSKYSTLQDVTGGGYFWMVHANADLTIRGTVTLTGAYSSGAGQAGLHAYHNLHIHTDQNDAAILNLTGGSGAPGGTGLYVAGTLDISGYLTLNVTGGNGIDGAIGATAGANGSNGGNGGVGINADTLNILSGATVTVKGGDGGIGGNGATGVDRGSASGGSQNMYPGGKGGNGGVGGEGTYALFVNRFEIVEGASVTVQAGNGGNGGNGGKGGKGHSTGDWLVQGANGGNGGNGGDGGNNWSAYIIETTTSATLEMLTIHTSQVGLGGASGAGGSAGKGAGAFGGSDWWGQNGSAGVSGKNGSMIEYVWNDSAPTYIYQNRSYRLITESLTWEEAKAACEAMGGHLVTITSAGENAFVQQLAGNNVVWLGASDTASEGAWVWVTGEAFVYSNWASSQPDNVGSGEDYLQMNFPDSESYIGLWNDNKAVTAYYICEWESASPIYDYNGHQYQLISNAITWEEANITCEAMGGHLVTITSQSENDFVTSLANGNYVWLGASDIDVENEFEWITNESFYDYTNFASGEPNNDGNQDYLLLCPGGKWDDAYVNVDGAGAFYICEWDD